MNRLILTVLLISLSATIHAQDRNKKVSFEVHGNCEMCKARIEKAAIKVKGVKYAQWDIPSKEISIIFNEKKCALDDIKRSIAAVGHDTEGFQAADSVYEKLPDCCKYRDPASMHMDHGKHNKNR